MRQNLIKSTKILFMTLAIASVVAGLAPMAAAQNSLGFQAQITDPNALTGDISARLEEDYTNADVYIALKDAQNRLFTLVSGAGGGFAWQEGIQRLSTHSRLAAGGWGFLKGIDFSNTALAGGDVLLLAVICPAGSDPYDSGSWFAWAKTQLITNPGEREEGQSQFYTIGASGQDATYGLDGGGGDAPAAEDTDNEDDSDDPEKADIYKLEGDRLYYANTSAAKLQMVDLSDPSAPVLAAEKSLSYTPNEMYVVQPYVYLIQTMSSASEPGMILSVMDAEASLNQTGQLALDGLSYVTSRRLGSTIFIVARPGFDVYFADDAATGPVVVAVDISTPSNPVETARYQAQGYSSDVYLDQSRLVLLAQQGWRSTRLVIFDLAGGATPLSITGTLDVDGYVPSEFHLKAKDDYLYVIFRQEDIESGSALAVYDISDLSAITKTGEVSGIAPDEELYAARFAADRAYLVTYERVDPLWVLDISNPASPSVLGELEVPGWSEHMVFFDDKLLAIGYDDSGDGRLVSTALFSVADPASPSLLDRVTPFSQSQINYSYSEAISDERAFYTDTDLGLVLFPLSYYSDTTTSGLEVVRLGANKDGFSANHFVACDFYVLRGAADDAATRAVSMGDAALSLIDVSPAATPAITGSLRLAYNASAAGVVDENGLLWTLGGDYYGRGGADLYLFDTSNLFSPSHVLSTSMESPSLVMTQTTGVLFASYPGSFTAFDPSSKQLGAGYTVGTDDYTWFTSPLVSGNTFYLAQSTYEQIPVITDTEEVGGDDDLSVEAVYGEAWELWRFDVSDIQAPEKQASFSIPGSPLGFTSGGMLVCVESQTVYGPVYADGDTDDSSDPVRDTYTHQVRLNLLTLLSDRAVLEKTRTFEGYYSHVMDKERIYLASYGDETTRIVMLDAATLETAGEYDLAISAFPIRADTGRLALSNYGPYYYDYGGIVEDSLWYPGYESGFSVYDMTGDSPRLLATDDTISPSASQLAFSNGGVYVTLGYKGVRYLPFD